MELRPFLIVLAIAGSTAPIAIAGQQSLAMENGIGRQKARPDPVPFAWPHHQNHFHVDIRPPRMVKITGATQNLMAEEAPIMLASADANIVTDTNTTTDQSAATSRKYDAVLGACQFVEIGNPMGSAINSISAAGPVYDFLKTALGQRVITILEQPRHGTLQLDTKVADAATRGGPWHYSPDPTYFGGTDKFYKGSDQFSFEVEANGKRFKVIYNVYVVFPVGNEIYDPINKSCPQPGVSWRISEAGAVTGDESYAMALNSWLATSALDGFVAAASGLTLTFADLQGAAVGQTGSTGITLDSNAAGYGWFIDTTPGLNEEWLPTSNPNEWVAKAGSDAAGKMDMLSVLLHEYGHALGINHSADPNDFMGTTLTAGVRRLPTADEMALMQQLVGQVKAAITESTPSLALPLQGGGDAPAFPTLPLGSSFIGFLGLLRGSRYGGVGIAPDMSTLVTQYDWAANPTLVNGNLTSSAGWSTQGGVEFGPSTSSGRTGAVLREVSNSQTRLSQAFLLGANDRYLSFTLSGTALDDLTGAPDDAFQVALLDANTGTSLLGGTGQTRTDAFLNLQADGSVNSTAASAASGLPTFGAQNMASCVTCITNTDGSRTYRIDLAGIPAGVAANLSFDLIGFGANGSHVTVSDVQLTGDLPQLHDDAATLLEDGTLAFNPFAQVDNAAVLQLGSHVVDQPAHGTVTINADGTFVYTPAAGYVGTDRRTSDTLLT